MASGGNVVLSDSAASAEGVQVSLHPLPLLNISEHYTRCRIQNGGSLDSSNIRVLGALIGTQAGRELEVVNSFELAAVLDETTNEWNINHDFFTTRQGQFKQVFPTFEFLGWYSIGAAPTPSDLSIHTQLLAYNESPIFLQLHPDTLQSQSSSSGAVSKLPLDMYESIVDIAGGKSETKFIRIATEAGGYRVETYEAERIAVETASRVSVASATATSSENQGGKGPSETGESTLIAGLSTQRNAISMLHSRIGAILSYLSAVQQGKVAPDHETLRQISSLVSALTSSGSESSSVEPPIATTSKLASSYSDRDVKGLSAEFEQEQSDVMLTSLLGLMTKNLEQLNTLVDKFGVAQTKDHPFRDDDMSMHARSRGGGHRRGAEHSRRSRNQGEGFGAIFGVQ